RAADEAREAAARAEARRKAAAEAKAEAARQKALEDADPRAVAQAMLSDFGWDASQFQCLDNIWTQESGWQVDAENPGSGAYGIPQSLPGSKMASAGSDWQTNPATQIRWGLGYIQDRYGSPCEAWSFKQGAGWY
ncbi:lytic transglycosylase domain-containing protein, partial [Aeromicrobium sp. CnD17-E]|nr:lytic transglycosylase domain-containing protein [Aeromicrobium sp. CnD17-E]